MPSRRGVLLTGSTGLLGQYLLKDLLVKSEPVTVLVRDSKKKPASQRIAEIINSWEERLGQKFPQPTVLCGELGQKNLGLTPTDTQWVSRNCQSVIHSAANVSFRPTPDGEPWKSNVEGTASLLEFCQSAGLTEWHHISTAFICGNRNGSISETDLDQGQSFNNPYEASKFEAEKLLRGTVGINPTIYRPSVIVGDSKTGHTTTFTGLYRFCEMAIRLGKLISQGAKYQGEPLNLRVPLSGQEMWNLVTVDWVSQAIVRLWAHPQSKGKTYHLVSQNPIPTKKIRDIGLDLLGLKGFDFAGANKIDNPNEMETMFLDGIRDYWPYLCGNPVFSTTNTKAALPDFPPPVIDDSVLKILVQYGLKHRWGRQNRLAPTSPQNKFSQSPIAHYLENTFPGQAKQSTLAQKAKLDITVSLTLNGPGGGSWSCSWNKGELGPVRSGVDPKSIATYETDTATFQSIIGGDQTPQNAFFDQKISIKGNMEKGLKLAMLLGQFLKENPAPTNAHREVLSANS